MTNSVPDAGSRSDGVGAEWSAPYEVLRKKWGTVPFDAATRVESRELLTVSDQDLLAAWDRAYHGTSTGSFYGLRGWYHDLYRHKLKGLKVLDLGCGLAVSSIHFAEHGARLTFSDIVSDNVRVAERLCALKGVAAEFLYIDDERSFAALPDEFDVVLALGSLLNAPLRVIRDEIRAILPHLKDGGRWLHLAYPKARWEREGSMPFSEWGNYTDGSGTPWMEYHDREKIEFLFAPADIEIVFDCEWHSHDFNWFDLLVHR
jgi:SAM-dependent methyltransferase